MLIMEISNPAAEVFGWFQIFEMKFIDEAPSRSRKGGRSRRCFSRFVGICRSV
jgi:hypothetical protein